jgi:hypothetical protein
MILPTKHINLQNSLLSTGAVLLDNIVKGQTVSLLWERVRSWPEINTFERFTLGLDLLYTFGLVEVREGIIVRKEV